MNKQRTLHLLNEGFNEGEREIALVHGTSTASLMDVMRHGFLSSGKGKRNEGYIYFHPVSEHVKKFNFYSSLKNLGLKSAEELAIGAAKTNEEYAYFNNLLGFQHWDMPLFEGRIQYGDIENEDELWKIIVEMGADKRIDKSKLKNILQESSECAGVLIGVNKIAVQDFQDKLEIDPEDAMVPEGKKCAVRLYLPEGLDEKYLQYVFPLGKREDKIIREFVEKELK